MRYHRSALVLVLVAGVVLLAGCASQPRPSVDPLGAAPEDLTIDLTVLVGRDTPPQPEAHRRPGRFVLFPDGSLHYGSERRRGAAWLPERVRVLDRHDVARVWSLARQLGFADPARGEQPMNFAEARPPDDATAYLVTFTAGDQSWSFISIAQGDDPLDPAFVQLTRRLAEFAWATDLPQGRVTVIPRRYDFGPDPYERYRTP